MKPKTLSREINIWVTRDGSAVLMDYGIATVAEEGERIGTPGYGAPETLDGITDIKQRFIDLFRGREDVHASQWVNRAGKVGYTPINRPITDDDVREHLAGDITLASYIHKSDNTVKFAVIDVDGKKESNRDDAMEMGFQIKQVAHRFGIPVSLEDSGWKGCHCWIFFSESIPAGLARKLGMMLVAHVQPLPKGVTTEVFPRQEKLGDDVLGPIMKLPYGVHKATGRRCMFLDRQGNPVELSDFLQSVESISVDAVKRTLSRQEGKGLLVRELPKASENVNGVLGKCGMLKRLCEKPALTGHLTHTERLILLYTLGRLGKNGSGFLHKVIGLCDNYDPVLTQQWLDRLDPDKPPIGCARIRDWMNEIEPNWRCDCQGTPELKGYKTPLAFAGKGSQDGVAGEEKKGKRKGRRLHTPAADVDVGEEEEWRGVADDLFSDEEGDP